MCSVLCCVVHCGSGNFKARKHFACPAGAAWAWPRQPARTEKRCHIIPSIFSMVMCALLPTLERAPERVAVASELIRTRCGTVHTLRSKGGDGRRGTGGGGEGAAGTQFSVGTQLCCQFGLFHFAHNVAAVVIYLAADTCNLCGKHRHIVLYICSLYALYICTTCVKKKRMTIKIWQQFPVAFLSWTWLTQLV